MPLLTFHLIYCVQQQARKYLCDSLEGLSTEPCTSLYYHTSCCSRLLIFNFQRYIKELDLKILISLNLRWDGFEDCNFINTRGLCLSASPCIFSAHAQNSWNKHCSNSLVFFTQLLLHKSGSSLPVGSTHFPKCRLPRKTNISIFFKQERISLL